jgi:hypothetical protein
MESLGTFSRYGWTTKRPRAATKCSSLYKKLTLNSNNICNALLWVSLSPHAGEDAQSKKVDAAKTELLLMF